MALEIWRNVRLAVVMFVLLAIIYSLAVLGVGQLAFPWQANGSLEVRNGKVVGSLLIGQQVTSLDLFHGRPSATVNPVTGKPDPYAANNSAGSNLGPTNRALVQEVSANIRAIRPMIGHATPPANLVESSGSGLDPEITVQDAMLQIPAISARTGIAQSALRNLVLRNAEGPLVGLYGPWRVNVLQLNLVLQGMLQSR
jgi:K+-transporting ATPase ATPase C chain